MKKRVRVEFEKGEILSKTQKLYGLNQSWVFLKPQFSTISDVVFYLLQSFSLDQSCPNGIILSMDGFVLPPFESIAILKDKDIICVKRKGTKLTKEIEGARISLEDKIVEKQPLPSETKLLADEKYEEQIGGDQSETDEDEDEAEEHILPLENIPCTDAVTRKRKLSGKVETSKTKKQRQVKPKKVQKNHALECTPQKKRKDKKGCKGDPISIPDSSMKCTKNLKLASEKCIKPNESAQSVPSVSMGQDGIKKCKSQVPAKYFNDVSGSKKELGSKNILCQQAGKENDEDGDLVPVIIRPGHIRLIPRGKVKDFQQNQGRYGWDGPSTEETNLEGHSGKRNAWGVKRNIVIKDTIQCNEIMNKKKGKRWGKKRNSTSSWKESREYNASPSFRQQDYTPSVGGRNSRSHKWSGTTNTRNGQKWGKEKQPTSSWEESRDFNAHSSWSAWKHSPGVNFEKLLPLTDSPQEGDVIAYRLLEMSSSWCPELSSFRIGKIAWFEPESNRIMLVPDPEYPLNIVKKTKDNDVDASGLPPESSVYSEDGSLKIEFPSLVDVRIVKRGDPSQPKGTITPAENTIPGPSGIKKKEDKTQDSNRVLPSHTPNPANEKRDVWEEMSEALSAKEAQFTPEDNWNKSKSAKQPWIRRVAILRAQNRS